MEKERVNEVVTQRLEENEPSFDSKPYLDTLIPGFRRFKTKQRKARSQGIKNATSKQKHSNKKVTKAKRFQ